MLRKLADLLEYIHSYAKYLYTYDLNEGQWTQISNEQIHVKFDHRNKCTYCVYDTRVRKGKERIIARCDKDVSTRSRFFKHLEELEIDLNRRLVCFDTELEVFKLDELLNQSASRSILLHESNDIVEIDNDLEQIQVQRSTIDQFLNTIRDQRGQKDQRSDGAHSDHLSESSHQSSTQRSASLFSDHTTYSSKKTFEHCEDSNLGDESGSKDSPNENSNLKDKEEIDVKQNDTSSDYLKYRTRVEDSSSSEDSSSDDEDDALSDCSLPFTPPRSPKRKGPVVKSIRKYEKEVRSKLKGKLKKRSKNFEVTFEEHNIVINEIIAGQSKFLCFLDQI